MVVIRLARHGSRHKPFYHVTVADRRARRDGTFIERVGFYNPIAKGKAERLRINLERVDYWVGHGAQTSQTVSRLVKEARRADKIKARQPAEEEVSEQVEAAAPEEEVPEQVEAVAPEEEKPEVADEVSDAPNAETAATAAADGDATASDAEASSDTEASAATDDANATEAAPETETTAAATEDDSEVASDAVEEGDTKPAT